MASGGDRQGEVKDIDDVFNIAKSSPKDGTIKIVLNPKKSCKVGDEAQIKVTLNGTGTNLEEILWVKITDIEQPKQESKKEVKSDDQNIGLPPFNLVYKEKKEGCLSWDKFSEATNEPIGWETVMCPIAKGDELESIYINMDSTVLKNFKAKYRNAAETQLELADRKYIASVYFHTLFLYTITKNRKYQISKENENNEEPVEISSYLKDLFESYYSEFILNFGGMEEMMQGLGD